MFFNIGHDTEILLYKFFTTSGFLIAAIYNFFSFKSNQLLLKAVPIKELRYKKGKSLNILPEAVITSIKALTITVLYYLSGGVTNMWMGKLLGTGANYFGILFFSPIILVLGCYLARLDVIRIFDLIAPTYPLALIFAKTGCFFAGCCKGIEWEHGLYNFDDKLYQVPVQLIEIAFALLLFIIFFSARKKIKTGTGFPLYMILYSSTRFFSEFLRAEPDIFIGLKMYHLCCITGVVVGIIIYIIALNFSEKISNHFIQNKLFFKFCYKINSALNKKRIAIKTAKYGAPIQHKKKKRKK